MLQINAEDLPLSEAFSYLGWKIAYNNSDWAIVYQNLRKARGRWLMIAMVLVNTGSTVQARGVMYKAVIQLMLLYGSERWMVTGEMLKVLE